MKKESNIPMSTEVSDYDSMEQRVYRLIKDVDPDVVVTFAPSQSQVAAIHI